MNRTENTINSSNSRILYRVIGMTCASCAISLETYLSPVNGIISVSVNYPNQSVSIEYDNQLISEVQIVAKAKEIGYELIGENNKEDSFENIEEQRINKLKKKLIVSAVLSIPVFVISMFFMGRIPFENWILFVLSTPALFWSGNQFFINAWKKLRYGATNMDTLVALSTGVAYGFSVFNTFYPSFMLERGLKPHVYYESAVVIITFILLGKYLEEKAKGKTSSAIKHLMGLKPKEVTCIRNGEETIIAISHILVGDLIVLKPGDKVPVDGKVKKGESYVDESMITGEPIPVLKEKKSKVIAGTINQKGSLRILAEKIGNDTLLAQIIKSVEQAQATKPKIQALVDRIASIFVPIVLLISVLTFIVWFIYGPYPTFTYALQALITVLIIACPCALGLATPTALMVGIGKGAELGILVKDAQTLETAFKTDVLILDKTGTITEGKPRVTDEIWFLPKEQFSGILKSIESNSEHPLAQAVIDHIDVPTIEVNDFVSHTGHGVQATVEKTIFFVGNYKLLVKNGITLSSTIEENAARLAEEGNTVIYFSNHKEVISLIGIKDEVKSNATEGISRLKDKGIEVYMLTGDNHQTAERIANQVGINQFRSEFLPSDKGDFVSQLQSEGKIVAMVGDGINDSHALAQADIGIAMGAGTDIAMESAGITLMHSNINDISKAIELSDATMKTIKQNLFWAFFYNIIALPIAAGVLFPAYKFLLNPMIAGAAMSFSSISVLSNSLRLKRKKI